MKPLLPSLREKNRYLAYQIRSKSSVTRSDAKKAIEQQVLDSLGEIETAKSSLRILQEWTGQQGIMKVDNRYVDKVRSALLLIRNINKVQATTKIISVSGTIKGARKYMKIYSYMSK